MNGTPGEALLRLLARAALTPRTRAAVLRVLARADAAWYWWYQGVLCVLDEDAGQADAMYRRE